MDDLMGEVRSACARVAQDARHVSIERVVLAGYAAGLPLDVPPEGPDPSAHLLHGSLEDRVAFWLTLDAVNFGSGWFPTLRKPGGRSGYFTIATGIRGRFATRGPWSADELVQIDAAQIAQALGQDPAHELMELFAWSLRDLGRHLDEEFGGQFTGPVTSAGDSAVAFVRRLAGWECFADRSAYEGFSVPFVKRAQLAAADLARAGLARFDDLGRLTVFADNLLPHVLRLDGILHFEPELSARIERGELIEHGSTEEIEIRACALHAVELILAHRRAGCAADLDSLLWHRGQGPSYKARPRHRCRCTAY